MTPPVSRRSFLAASAGTAGYFLTASARSAEKVAGSNDRLRFAGIGVGGKGQGDTTHAGKFGDMVALCDVDDTTLGKKTKEFPSAEKFFDYRKLFDSPLIKNIDAVTVSTPDHTHALATVRAMQLGKHVYCQKPLTHSVYEAHLVRKLAAETGVCTQMGNQGTSNPGLRRAVELIRAGTIGTVREAHVWTNRPVWPQAPLVTARPAPVPVPSDLHWEEWIGPAPFRPYAEYPDIVAVGKRMVKKAYHTFAWRGWWDFGTGAIGDMACHTANLAFHALRLTQPTEIVAEAGDVNPETCPSYAHVTMQFPANGDRSPVTVHWYEGRKDGELVTPPKELLAKVLKKNEKLASSGSILVGSKAILYSPDDYGAKFFLFGDVPEGLNLTKPEKLPFYESGAVDENQKREWVEAIKAGKPELAMSNFGAAGLLTSSFLLGNAAMRTGGVPIQWDAKTLTATGPKGVMALINPPARKGWELPAMKG